MTSVIIEVIAKCLILNRTKYMCMNAPLLMTVNYNV